MLTPWVVFTDQAAPAAADHSVLWVALVTQAVTLGLFYWAQRESRRRDRRELKNHRKKERETLRLTLKREVLLEVAPAIQRNYLALSQLVDLQVSFPDLQKKIKKTILQSVGAISKLQAVADDDTLEAARQVQTLFGTAYFRLMEARIALGGRKDIDAIKEITCIWKQEIAPFPQLLVNFLSHARGELFLPFDKKRFEAGVVDSNAKMFAQLDKIIDSLA